MLDWYIICISMCTGFVCWACSHKEPQQQERVRQAFVAVKAAADKAKTTVQVSRGSRGLIRWVVAVIDISTQFSCETCCICWETEDYQIWVFGIHLRDQDWQPIQEKSQNVPFIGPLSWSLNIFRTFRPLPRLPWHDPPCRMKPVWSQVGAIEMMVVLTEDYILQTKMPWNINWTWNMN